MNSGHYYELLTDPEATSRWYLKSPVDSEGHEIDPRLFTQGLRVDHQPSLAVPLRRQGNPLDFNFCDFDMIISPASLNEAIESVAKNAIQRIPVTADNRENEFEILNICNLIDCVDESRSLLTKWTVADGRPEKAGQFRMIANLKINPAAASGHDIFRVAGWPIAVVVSEKIKTIFEERNVSGLKYERVD